MDRISTSSSWGSALLNLMQAQGRQASANNQLSSTKVADDLKGYGAGSQTVTALKSSQTKLNGYIATGQTVSARLTTQDLGLNQVADAATGARQAITDALANGTSDGLMDSMQAWFQQAVQGLNTQNEGQYVFSGGNTDQAPVSVTNLSDLDGATVSNLFSNGQAKQTSKLDDSTTVTTGFLASDLGQKLFTAFQTIQQFNSGSSGPLSGTLTDAQTTFLQSTLASFDSAAGDLTTQAALNGNMQTRVDAHVTLQQAQATTLDSMLSDHTDADTAKATTDLQLATLAVQASAQVISGLKDTSLLNLLAAD